MNIRIFPFLTNVYLLLALGAWLIEMISFHAHPSFPQYGVLPLNFVIAAM